MDDATKVLAEATFRSGFSNPMGEDVSRAWMATQYVVGYREGIIRGLLRAQGYDVVKIDG